MVEETSDEDADEVGDWLQCDDADEAIEEDDIIETEEEAVDEHEGSIFRSPRQKVHTVMLVILSISLFCLRDKINKYSL